MDVARTCYSGPMRFFWDDTTATTVRWYRCKPGAKPLPWPHVFGNTFYDPEYAIGDLTRLGELEGRAYSKLPAPDGADGLHYCGTQAQYQGGFAYNALAPIPVQQDGLLACCFGPPAFDPVQHPASILAFGKLFSGQSFDFAEPTGITLIRVTLQGGGAYGGAGQSFLALANSGGGGGGGAFAESVLNVQPGDVYTLTANGPSSATRTGPDGTDISFANLVLAKGGKSGIQVDGSPLYTNAGGAGGDANECIGQIRYSGGAGGDTHFYPFQPIWFLDCFGGAAGCTATQYGPGGPGENGWGPNPDVAKNNLFDVLGIASGFGCYAYYPTDDIVCQHPANVNHFPYVLPWSPFSSGEGGGFDCLLSACAGGFPFPNPATYVILAPTGIKTSGDDLILLELSGYILWEENGDRISLNEGYV